MYNSRYLNTQNDLLMSNLLEFFKTENHIQKMMSIVEGQSKISLRIIDWFVTNYAKKYFVVYEINGSRFKVYNDYKLKLKAYGKVRFDPFKRWDRITIRDPQNQEIETTIGQLNFFKWAIDNKILEYIESQYDDIEKDMNQRNSSSKKRLSMDSNTSETGADGGKTRKKREELSVSATKFIKKETVKIVVKFT
jgi:hypothetical protein